MLPSTLRHTLLLLVLVASAAAQTTTPDTLPAFDLGAPMPAKPALHFKLNAGAGRGELIIIQVETLGKPRLFILDTGCTHTILDERLRAQLGPPIRETTMSSAVDPSYKVKLYQAPVIKCQGVELIGPQADATTLDMRPLEKLTGKKIEGFLGFDALAGYSLRLDFHARTLDLVDTLHFTPPPPDPKTVVFDLGYTPPTSAGMILPITWLPLLGAAPFRVQLDTGHAGFGAISTDTQAKLAIPGIKEIESAAETASGRNNFAQLYIQRPWSLGATRFPETLLSRALDNRVGIDFLANYISTWDFAGKKLYLQSIRDQNPKPHLHRDFAIAWDNGRFVIEILWPAGEALGLRKGDQLFSVDGTPVSGLERWQVGELFHKEAKLPLQFRRGDQSFSVTVDYTAANNPLDPPTTSK